MRAARIGTVMRAAMFFVVMFAGKLHGADSGETVFSWWILLMTLLGGLALFLYGMGKLSEGLKKAAGNRMRVLLSALTDNRVVGMFVGAFVTMVIQSSSATTVMLVSFVQAQLMTFSQSLGVILGADIGTTVTAQLIAFKVTQYALLMIAGGFGLTMLGRRDAHRHVGEAILGFGILFFGMKLMSDAMAPLRSYPAFVDLLKNFENPLFGILIGTVLTAVIQSSSAFIGIVIVLAQQGVLTLEAGIPLIFGANVGTCVTAGLSSVGAVREAKRVALAHVLFKIGGVALFVLWIPTFAGFIRSISPVADGSGLAKLAAETPRQIANAHTIFNVSLALVFLPFTSLFAWTITKVYPTKKEEIGLRPTVRHIEEGALATPALAIDLARAEISRMLKIVARMLEGIIRPFIESEPWKDEYRPQLSVVEAVEMREGKIDYLDEKVTDYLMKTSRKELDESQANEVFLLMSVVKDMESIGDIIDKNIVTLIEKKQMLGTEFSPEGTEELETYHVKVSKQFSRLKDAFESFDPDMAVKVMTKEEKYEDLESQFRIRHLERVQHEVSESVQTHEIHMELMDLLKQINAYTASIGKTILRMAEAVSQP